jgi:glycosyltransferase involved in cell wall biosynthesis
MIPTMKLDCTIVMPAYNEGDDLTPIVEQVVDVMTKTSYEFEIVLIDDGSSDNTWAVLDALREKHTQVKALHFARNFGHQLAVHAGIKAAAGDMVAVMDSDGQDPPSLLPEMFDKIKNDGYDVVNCIRKKRKESTLKRFCYYTFYRLYSRLVPFEMQLDSGDFSAMNRDVADTIASVSQHTPFIRGIRSWAGGKHFNLEYEREARHAGTSKYSVVKLFLLALDGITSFSKVPLRLSIVIGTIVSMASIFYAIFIVIAKLTTGYPGTPEKMGWASLAFLTAFLGGMILTVLGIIGEYLGHIFDAVRGMPPYLVDKKIGFEEKKEESGE